MTIQLNISNQQDIELILGLVRRLNIPFQKLENSTKNKVQNPHVSNENLEADYPRLDMAAAAALLADEYLNNEELIAFTVLDSEDFYEQI